MRVEGLSAAYPERYKQPDSWPHRFTKKSGEYAGSNGYVWQDMVCASCFLEYTHGRQSRPTGKCPARTDKKELRRLLG